MKTFRFSLELLLDHRKTLEEKERLELSRINLLFQKELAFHQNLEKTLRQTMGELARKRSESADHQELTWFHLYLERLKLEMRTSLERLGKLQAQVDAQKQVVIEACKKTKVLDSLRSKKEKQFLFEVDKREQKAVDELVVTRYSGSTR